LLHFLGEERDLFLTHKTNSSSSSENSNVVGSAFRTKSKEEVVAPDIGDPVGSRLVRNWNIALGVIFNWMKMVVVGGRDSSRGELRNDPLLEDPETLGVVQVQEMRAKGCAGEN